MCSFRGSFSGAAKNVAKLGTFSESAKFFAIFFRFRRFSYSQAGFMPDGAAPAETLWRWREPPFPESECKVRHSYGSLQIFQEKFSRKYVVKHVFEAKFPASNLTGSRLQQKKIFWQKREKKRGNQREERSRRKGRRRERTRSGVIRA